MAKWETAPLASGGGWKDAPIDHGIDWAQPIDDVRGAIAKLDAADREDAIRQWADAYVARERQGGGVLQGIDTAVRTAARGTLAGPFLDELTGLSSAALHKLSGGHLGAPYDETVAYQRAKDRAVDREYPVASFAGKVAGGVAGGLVGAGARATAGGVQMVAPSVGPNVLMNGPVALLPTAASGAGRIAQGVAGGAAAGGIAGFGEGDGTLGNRVEHAATGAAVGGALGAALGGAAETIRGMRSAVAGQGRTGAYDRFASQLPDQNVDTFANQVATGAERNGQAINRRTLDILGEEMTRANGDRGQAVASTVARISREAGVAPATAREHLRRLTAVHRDSNLMLSEYPAVAEANGAIRSHRDPANIDLQDAGRIRDSGAHFIIDDLANNPGAGSSSAVRNAVTERNLGTRDAMRGTLDDLAPRAPGGTGPRTIADLDQMQEGARRAASIEYQQAYAAPTNRLLLGMLPRILDRHANRMAGRSGEQAQALGRAIDEFMLQRPGGQRIAMMTLQQLQDARGALRVQIDTARRGGQNHIVGTLQPLYQDVTRLMERANPTWAQANRRWADNALDTVGRDLGEAMSLRAGPQFRAQMQQFDRLAPQAQDMVRVEFLQRMADRLDNLGDGHDVAKLFTTDHMRAVVERLFGRQGVVALVQAARDAGVATRSGRMLGGSQTAMRLARRSEADAETGIMGAAEIASIKGVRNALMQRLATIRSELRNMPLAEIATTPMADTAAVAQAIHNMRTAQRYRQRVSQPSPATAPTINALMNATGQWIADERR